MNKQYYSGSFDANICLLYIKIVVMHVVSRQNIWSESGIKSYKLSLYYSGVTA